MKILAHIESWRLTLYTGLATTSFVLLTTVALLLVGYFKLSGQQQTLWTFGTISIFDGDCGVMESIKLWSHLTINVLGSLLFAASADCMTCLNSPNREEVDKAHEANTYLDIGVTSMRNFRWMPRKRFWCWLLLGSTSLVQHLFLNAMLFPVTKAEDNLVIVTAQNFLTGDPWHSDYFYNGSPYELHRGSWPDCADDSVTSNGKIAGCYDNLTPRDYTDVVRLFADKIQIDNGAIHSDPRFMLLDSQQCVQEFSKDYVSDFRSVMIVLNITNKSNALLGMQLFPAGFQSMSWTCGSITGECNDKSKSAITKSGTPDWQFFSPRDRSLVPVQHCIAEISEEFCQVAMSPSIVGLVICCNLVKLVVIAVTLVISDKPLIIIGDAIESFLAHPEPKTIYAGVLSGRDVRKAVESRTLFQLLNRGISRKGIVPIVDGRWHEGANMFDWIVFIFLCISSALFAMIFTVVSSPVDFLSISTFGNPTRRTVMSWSHLQQNPFILAVVSNVPHLLIAMIYLLFTQLLTAMLVCIEFARYYTGRKGLRVSSPKGLQRRSHWLNTPIRFAIPVTLIMMLLHWLASNSIMIASIEVTSINGELSADSSVLGIGFSGLATICTCVVIVLVSISLIVLGRRRLPDGPPIVGSNSLAIAAACHRDDEFTPEMLTQPVNYGILRSRNDRGKRQAGFSAGEVQPLITEEDYGLIRARTLRRKKSVLGRRRQRSEEDPFDDSYQIPLREIDEIETPPALPPKDNPFDDPGTPHNKECPREPPERIRHRRAGSSALDALTTRLAQVTNKIKSPIRDTFRPKSTFPGGHAPELEVANMLMGSRPSSPMPPVPTLPKKYSAVQVSSASVERRRAYDGRSPAPSISSPRKPLPPEK